jgi:hypothetical protein
MLVGLAVVASGCSADSSDEVVALEERIAELEATTSSSTTSIPPTTTSSTTTTTQPPATTTTISQLFDLESIDYAILIEWVEDGDVPEDFIPTVLSSCDTAVTTLAKFAESLVFGLELPIDAAVRAENGEIPVSDAVKAFEDYSAVVTLANTVAKGLENRTDLGGVVLYAREMKEALGTLLFQSLSVTTFVFDAEANTIDAEAVGVWMPGLTEAQQEFGNLMFRTPAAQC